MATKFITISIEIMHDINLNQSQKFILAEIEQLSQLDKGCIASNKHFSELIGITKENVSRNINELDKKGYISIEIVKGTRNHTRIITLTTLVRPPYQNSKTPLLKQQETKGITKLNKTTNNKREKLLSYVDMSLNINLEALKEWLEFKKYDYEKAGITKTCNFLSNYSIQEQQQIIDNSIMNNYKGLFPPKQQNQPVKTKKQASDDFIDNYFGNINNNNPLDVEVIQ